MILSAEELQDLYEAVIKPFGHPDPLGFVTRAIIFSGGDPDYIDTDGLVGFMPVDPTLAMDMVGAQEVQSLQGNLVATLAIDRILFNEYKSINEMIVRFHFPEVQENVLETKQAKDLIKEVNETREEILDIMYPKLATVDDVIKLIQERDKTTKLTDNQSKFFDKLIGDV